MFMRAACGESATMYCKLVEASKLENVFNLKICSLVCKIKYTKVDITLAFLDHWTNITACVVHALHPIFTQRKRKRISASTRKMKNFDPCTLLFRKFPNKLHCRHYFLYQIYFVRLEVALKCPCDKKKKHFLFSFRF